MINDTDCLSLTLGEASAIQASSALKIDGDVTHQELLSPSEQRATWGAPSPCECGEFSGVEYEYLEGGIFWRRWYLRKGRVLLFVTYNAEPQVVEKERSRVNAVLASAQFTPTEA